MRNRKASRLRKMARDLVETVKTPSDISVEVEIGGKKISVSSPDIPSEG